METIEVSGKNVEEAVKKGLEKLDLKREDVKIEILEKGGGGFLGIGGKEAKVRIIPKEEYFLSKAKDIAEETLRLMGFDAEVEVEKKNYPYLNIKGEELGPVIGRRGQTLDALQFILNLILSRKGLRKRIIVDSKGYRERRRRFLTQLALKAAKRASSTKKEVVLEPMNPRERHIIHITLQNHKDVVTKSKGEGERRRVVVLPKEGESEENA
jgi:spoIIIJ-associated protein